MKYIYSIVAPLLLLVLFAQVAMADDLEDGSTHVYLPLVLFMNGIVSGSDVLVTLADMTLPERLPITWVIEDDDGDIVERGSREDSEDINIWTVALDVDKRYYIIWSGKKGDTCTRFTVFITKQDHAKVFTGSCIRL